LNFCLDDGATLAPSNTVDNSIPATVLLNQPRQTAPFQSFDTQPKSQSSWNQNPDPGLNQFTMQPPPKKSKGWLWAVGILGVLTLLCGGGFAGFVFWAASLENTNRGDNSNYSIVQQSPTPGKTTTQRIDLSKWVQTYSVSGTTEYTGGEFLMSSKMKGYYYVLASQANYKTENATTKVTVRNVNEDSTTLGFGLVIHSNPTPLQQDYAFLIDSESKKYRVVRHVPGDEISVIGWTRSPAIKDGTQKNVLEVRDENKKMNFYINGEFVKTVDNKDGYSGGVTGLYTGDAVQVAFSDFEISK
jgi:hypothetical protein